MSVAASAKAYLVGESGVLAPLLSGVTVAYSMPSPNVPRELVYGGTVVGPVSLAAFAGGGRVKRSEDLTLMLHIRVYTPGKRTTEVADARAVAIGDVIATYIAGDWTFGGLADLKKAVVAGVELDGWLEDDGACSTLDLAIGLTSYLT